MNNEWDLTASMDSDDGTFASSDNTITGITFNDDGTLNASGDTTLQFSFNGISTTQSVIFDLGASGKTNGLTQNGSLNRQPLSQAQMVISMVHLQKTVSIDKNGIIKALYTNGNTKDIATLKLALFNNLNGLTKVGDNLYEQTSASGEAIYMNPNSGRAGSIASRLFRGI